MSKNNDRTEKSAEMFIKKYKPYMNALEKYSPLAKTRQLTAFDYVNLGEQLEQFENYRDFVLEAGSSSDLGVLPNVALDIITASYGASVVPLVSSVQPIEEERGTIYFKQIRALNTRGIDHLGNPINAGDVLSDPRTEPVYREGYAGERKFSTVLTATDGTTLAYSGAAASLPTPIRPHSVRIHHLVVGPYGQDDGLGNIMGVGLQGTIDYATGAWSVEFLSTSVPASGNLLIDYATDFEESANADIPKVSFFTDSTDISAEIFVVGSEVGLFKSYSMRKRFGKAAEEEMVTDLTNEITAELGNTVIRRLTAAAPAANNVSWGRGSLWFLMVRTQARN